MRKIFVLFALILLSFSYAQECEDGSCLFDHEQAGNAEALEQSPLWQSLSAVQAGNTYFVPGYWWRSQTYLLANKVVDDLFTHLAGTDAQIPVLELP